MFAERERINSPFIAVSLIEKDKEKIYAAAEKIVASQPDMIEWRVDKLEEISIDAVMQILPELQKRVAPIPLYFTCRSYREGGCSQEWSSAIRQQLIKKVARSGLIAGIDTELSNKKAYLDSVKTVCQENKVQLILSHHNFVTTPSQKSMVEILLAAESQGADIAKIAVMPKKYEDVISLLFASLRAKQCLTIPFIAVSMADMGTVSRLVGGLFGSIVTFAMVENQSAPGQLPIDTMRKIIQLLYTTKGKKYGRE